MHQSRRTAFTLVELLVVITIIGVLISLLLPAVQAARESARQMQCSNNLKQLALACHTYESIHRGLPLLYPSSNQPGWITQVLALIEQQNLYDQYKMNLAWFDADNAVAVRQRISVLECPSNFLPHLYTGTCTTFTTAQTPNPLTVYTVASTDYFAISGASSATTVKSPSAIPAGYFYAYPNAPSQVDRSGPFGVQNTPPVCRKLAETTDGLSNTLMISEMSGRPWLYLASGQQVAGAAFPSYVSSGSADIASGMALNYGWGAWAHNNNFNLGTWSRDGTMQGGDSAINCSNYRGILSFHPQGACAAFGDGSVHVLGREMSPAVYFALITSRAGEVVAWTGVY